MTLCFFVIGLEIKREMVSGELSEPRKRVIPVAGAVGGAVVPVLIFLFVLKQGGGDGQRAWAVPMLRISRSWWGAWRCWASECLAG